MDGIKLYHEIYGEGDPLVLIHGGLTTVGGASAIRVTIQHAEKVRWLVVISSPYARSGWYPEAQRGMSHVGAAMAENMM